jgi:hypothetical protein
VHMPLAPLRLVARASTRLLLLQKARMRCAYRSERCSHEKTVKHSARPTQHPVRFDTLRAARVTARTCGASRLA